MRRTVSGLDVTPGGHVVLHGAVRPVSAASVVALVHQRVLASPHAVAVETRDRSTTFEVLWRRAGAIAAALRDAGVGPGSRVAIWGDRTAGYVAAAIAVMAVRAAYVPIEPAHPPDRVRAVLRAAEPVVLCHDGSSDLGRPPPAGMPELDVAEVPDGPELDPRGFPAPDDAAYVIFTSGSTGQPKGVVVEHRSLTNYAAWCAAAVAGDGAGSPLLGSLGYDLSITSLWPALIRGEPVVFSAGTGDQRALFRPLLADQPRYAFVKVTPSHLRLFERTTRPDYRDLTARLVIGGEALDPALVAAMADRLDGVRLMNHYGPTEATVGCCFFEFDSTRTPALPSVPIGRPIWNTRCYLVAGDAGADLRPAAPGEPAELVVAGQGVARGYLGDGHREADRFVDEADLGGPPGRAYRTGDRVELLPDRTLRYLGRDDDQVKVSGHRVELGELRRHALAVAGVADAAFEVRRDEDVVEAYVVPGGDLAGGADLGQAVRDALRAALPPAVVPREVYVVPELRLTANGKRDLEATRQLARERP